MSERAQRNESHGKRSRIHTYSYSVQNGMNIQHEMIHISRLWRGDFTPWEGGEGGRIANACMYFTYLHVSKYF